MVGKNKYIHTQYKVEERKDIKISQKIESLTVALKVV